MEDTKAKFILKNSSPAMANALRRTMLQDIPKMAIDKVDFHLGPIMGDDKEYESVTSLFDEVIAHRLGLVPVPTTDQFTFQDRCSCGGTGCPGCTIMYSLNKVGPCTVVSGDLAPLGDQTLKVKDEHIPIVELTDSQAVLIYATAVMGTAKQHVKWQAAFGVGYSYMPIVKIDDELAKDPEIQDRALSEYPGLFKVEGGALVVDDLFKACVVGKAVNQDPKLKAQDPKLKAVNQDPKLKAVNQDRDAVHVEWDDKDFIFTFETDGSLTAKQVLDKAVEILLARAKEFQNAVCVAEF